MVPYVLFGFWMGVLADAIDRRRLLLASLLVMAATSAAMLLLTVAGAASYAAAAVVVMVAGAFWTTDMPVRRRLLVDAVEGGNVAAALGFDNATMYATRALGPLIGGATYQALGIGGIYALIAASYLVCVWLAARIGAGCARAALRPRRCRTGLRVLLPPEGPDPRSPLPGHHGRDAGLQPVVLAVRHHGAGHRPAGLRPQRRPSSARFRPATAWAARSARWRSACWQPSARCLRFYYLGTLSFLLLMLVLSLSLTVGTAVAVLLLLGLAAAAFSSTQYALVYTIARPEMRGRAAGVLSIFIGSSMFGHWHTGLLFERLGSAAAMRVMVTEGVAAMLALAILWRRARQQSGAG